jgi:glycosyltransferase involved in cell wall biosynthesis
MKNKKPLVSVVIPVFNAEAYLEECLDSVVSQTYSNLEVLLINDGSTDKSGEIIDIYASKDGRISTIHQRNAGASAAKNKGIARAKGKYITFIDADDYIRDDFIENLMNDMAENGVLIVTTPAEIYVGDADPGTVVVYDKSETLEKMFYGVLEKSYNGIQMFDTKLVMGHNIMFDPAKKIGEDFDFFVNALMHCDIVAVDFRKMYYYRPNLNSVMHQKVNASLLKAADTFAGVGDKLISKYPDLQRAVAAKKFSDSVSLAMRTYGTRDQWKEEYATFRYTIDSLKWGVLFDQKVRIKVRLATLCWAVRLGLLC